MKRWKLSALAWMVSFALSDASFASAPDLTPPSQPTCTNQQNCVVYSGDTSQLETISVGLQNSSKDYSKSVGFSSIKWSSDDSPSGNTVYITSGEGIEGVIRGAADDTDDVSGNLVYIDLSQQSGSGASLIEKDTGWNYSLEFDDSGGFISGGSTVRGTSSNNKVFIRGTYDPSNSTSEQKGKISGGTITGGSAIGVRSTKRLELTNNQVWLENVYMVAPTESGASDASSRKDMVQEIIGSRLQFSPTSDSYEEYGANLDQNSVVIKDSKLWVNRIAATYAETVTNQQDWNTVTTLTGYQTNDNVVHIDNADIELHNFGIYSATGVFAAYSFYRDANRNAVSIQNSNFDVYSDNTPRIYIHSVTAQAGESNDNSLTLLNTTFTYHASGSASAKGLDFRTVTNHMSATNNQMSLLGNSSFEGVSLFINVYSLAQSGYDLSKNTLLVDGQEGGIVTFKDTSGSLYNIYSSNTALSDITVNSNSTTIRNASFEGTRNIMGVYLSSGTSVKEASNNVLTLENATLAAGNSLYGIYTTVGGNYQNNTVKIGQNVKGSDGSIASFSTIAGVYVAKEPTGSSITLSNNTLDISSQISASRLAGFSHMIFNLDGYTDSSRPYIQVTEAQNPVMVVEGQASGQKAISSDTTSIAIVGSSDALNALSDPIVLIASQGGFVDETQAALEEGDYSYLLTEGATVYSVKSLARVESHSIDVDKLHLSIENMTSTTANPLRRGRADTQGQNLVLSVDNSSSNPVPIPPPTQPGVDENGAVTESALSDLNTQFLSDDLLVDSVLLAPTRFNDGLFAAARTGRYHVHSQAKQIANTSNALLGYGQSVGQSTVGLFVETGYSSYDTTVATALGNVVGDGSSSYAGAGVFGLYPLGSTGLFLQGYVKAGYLSHHYDVTLSNVPVNFDRATPYWSAQLGLSWDYQLTDRVQAKTFLNYYYDGQGSETFDLAGTSSVAGAHFELDAMNAHRLVLGQMWTYQYQDDLKPYVGLRIEEALKAKATGQARDGQGYVPLGDTDLEGTTGIVSMGYSYTPTNANYGVHIGANGYVGVRNGVSAQIEANWRF